MRAGAAGVLAALAIAGCSGDGGDSVERRPAPPGPEDCVYQEARDAGSATPSADDPRTLVLRLRDLPDGALFNTPMGVERITYEGSDVTDLLERARFRHVARGAFKHGYQPRERDPAAPPRPEPRACTPATVIDSAALAFVHAAGARLAFRQAESLAGSTVGSGIGPVGARVERRDSPVPAGDEATLIEAPSDNRGTVNRTIVWRDGPLIGMVKVVGRGGARDQALLERLTRRQAEYVTAAAD